MEKDCKDWYQRQQKGGRVRKRKPKKQTGAGKKRKSRKQTGGWFVVRIERDISMKDIFEQF